MATINNSDLKPTGLDLFSDSEDYMDELDDNELASIHGGYTPLIFRATYAAARSSQQCAMGMAGVTPHFPDFWGRPRTR